MPELRFSTTEDLVERFESMAKELGIPSDTSKKAKYSTILELLLETFHKSKTQNGSQIRDTLSETELSEIERAEKSGANLKELMRVGLVAEARRWNSQQSARSELEKYSYRELKYGIKQEDGTFKKITFKGVAEERIKRAIEELKAHNDSCEDAFDKVHISSGVVFSVTNVNRKALSSYFETPSVESDLEAHHQKHGLDENHNRDSRVRVSEITKSVATALENQ